jgi:pimeloyl-ACP methyl ester carboxylesterase
MRRRPHWHGLVAFLGFSASMAAGCGVFVPAEPGDFYTPPSPLPEAAPGTLLRSEPLSEALPAGASAWRILYLSTDHTGAPVAVSGVVAAPAGEAAAPRPVLAWAHGTVGILPRCGVSHTSDPYQQTPAIDAMLREGHVVVATDYPGLSTPGLHPYLVGPTAAHAVIDAVRAARVLKVAAGPRFAVWGASQGGHAALWTAQLAGDYAPELELVAAAASAPATDLAGIVGARYDAKPGGVFISEVLYAWDRLYPGTELDEIIQPGRRARFERMATTCFTTPAAFLLVGGVLTPREYLRRDIREVEPWARLLRENTPRGRIRVPLLLTQGTADDVVPPSMTEAEAARRCGDGETVTYVSLPGVGHDAREESAELALGWLRERFAGRPPRSTCGA